MMNREVTTKSIGQICNIKTGRYDANHAKDNGKYMFYTCALEPSKCDTYSFDGKLIMLPGNGANLGEVMYYEGKVEAYQRTYVLYDIQCNAKYLYHYLRGMWKHYIYRRQVGSATNYMKINDITTLEIMIPNLEVQKKVVKVLDKSQELIDKRKEQIAALDELVKSKFIEMFGKCLEKKRLEEYTTLITKGSSPKWQGFDYCDKGTLFVTSENVREGYLDFTNRKYLPNEVNNVLKRSILKRDDILINIVNASIGRAAIYDSDELANINQAVCLVRVKQEEINLTFLLAFLNSDEAIKAYNFMKVGGDKANLSLKNISDLMIPIVDIRIQNDFAKFVQQVDKLKSEMEGSLRELEDNFNSLMQKAFRGELF